MAYWLVLYICVISVHKYNKITQIQQKCTLYLYTTFTINTKKVLQFFLFLRKKSNISILERWEWNTSHFAGGLVFGLELYA